MDRVDYVDQFRAEIQAIALDHQSPRVEVQTPDTEMIFHSGELFDLVEFTLPARLSLPALVIKLSASGQGETATLDRFVRAQHGFGDLPGIRLSENLQWEALQIVRSPLVSKTSRFAVAALTPTQEGAFLALRSARELARACLNPSA